MAFAAWVLGGTIFAFILASAIEAATSGLTFRQALAYFPLKLLWRIDDTAMGQARTVPAPVVYVVSHQSAIDPALMLALLPHDTLHILDPATARSGWMEPFRAMARTITFNHEHVFVSRRLVRHLKGKGRLAVYLPEAVEPDKKTLRLYRAIARIAMRADATIVPLMVKGGRNSPFSLVDEAKAPRKLFPALKVMALRPFTMPELMLRGGPGETTATHALFDRVADVRYEAGRDGAGTLFDAMAGAMQRFGAGQTAVADPLTGSLTYGRMMAGARVLARRFAALSLPGEPVGLMLPNANGVAVAFIALQSAARVAAMINYTAGPSNVAAAIRTAKMRTVISSRAFVEKAELQSIVTAIEAAGAHVVWLEDMRETISLSEKLAGMALRSIPVQRCKPGDAAVILFTSGSEGTPKGVVLSHDNMLANVAQVDARIDFSPRDRLFNVLPVFHSFGLTGGTILPLVSGVELFLYPSPLHYKLIPQAVAKVKPTIMFGTDTFLAGYARTAKDSDFASLRMVVAGAEAVKPETERVWRERFGAQVLEGFGMTEAAPVVAVNSHTHGRLSTVGRLLPGMEARLEPVEGIERGGRMWIRGPNVMLGYMTADRPGELQPPADGWHDSGDIVEIDRDGYLAIRGRAKRFAKVAGEMVSLGAVEMLVQALWPEERHAAVSVPDRRKGERVVLVTTAVNADPDQLRDHGRRAGVTELMVPNDIVKVPDIPVLGSGKTDYNGAREIALEKLGLKKAA
ncbi:MAG: AMP-binding protein [Notoacmeibacter sp.]|nr:AMP-binding protein [Notoacmeibacter sp.]